MSVETVIKKAKAKLIREANAKGVYENFGQREVREIRDMFPCECDETKLDILEKINDFDNWCQTYTG